MKGTSKVMMGAALVIVVSLAIILGIVLILLAELYCSLLCRRRRERQVKLATSATTAAATAQVEVPTSPLSPSPLSSFYSQGVLDAPRNFLFPRVDQQQQYLSSHGGGEGDDHGDDGISDDLEVQRGKLHQLLNIQSTSTVEGEISTAVETRHKRPTRFNLQDDDDSADQSSSPSPTYIDPPRYGTGGRQPRSSLTSASSVLRAEKVVYISNPIYDNNNNNDHALEEESCRKLPEPWPASIHDQERPTWDVASKGDGGGGCDDFEEERETTTTGTGMVAVMVVRTPPLSPMKELPAAPKVAVSVGLRDARCLGTSGSESNSQNAASYYSSSSGSPRTSPSW